jgi:hypothetical protein
MFSLVLILLLSLLIFKLTTALFVRQQLKTLNPTTLSGHYSLPDLPNGYKCDSKHHAQPTDFAVYDNSYFTQAYKNQQKKKNVQMPTNCLRCKAEFIGARQKPTAEKFYKVTGAFRVRACQECFTPSFGGNKCNRAFCSTCYEYLLEKPLTNMAFV